MQSVHKNLSIFPSFVSLISSSLHQYFSNFLTAFSDSSLHQNLSNSLTAFARLNSSPLHQNLFLLTRSICQTHLFFTPLKFFWLPHSIVRLATPSEIFLSALHFFSLITPSKTLLTALAFCRFITLSKTFLTSFA